MSGGCVEGGESASFSDIALHGVCLKKVFVHKELDKHRFGRWVHANGMCMVYLFIYYFMRNGMVHNEQHF